MNTTPQDTVQDIFTKYRRPIIGAGIALLVVILVISVVSYVFSVKNEGERTEERIEALYKVSQTSLSTCLGKSDIAAQVTKEEFKTLQDLLTAAAAARYTNNGEPTNATGVLGGGQLISALQEQWPQVDQRSWQNLQTLVVGCRGEFEGTQNRIFLDAAEFEQWVKTDNMFNYLIKKGFPSENLDVIDLRTGETVTGQAALEYMTRVIETQEGRDAFRDGILPEQELFN